VYKAAKVTFLPGSKPGIALLALLLMLPALAAFFTDHDARSLWEKRQLTTWSTVVDAESAKQFFSGLEDYLDDHIGFALELNRSYRQVQFYLFGDSPVANVDIGEDGFVFLNAQPIDKPFSQITKLCMPRPRQVDITQKAIEQLAAVVTGRQINMTFAVVPSKLLLYADRLPNTVPKSIREACINLDPQDSLPGQLVRRAVNVSYRVYYPIEHMLELRDEDAFYPPQNFHANSRINHEFGRGLLQQLGIEPGTKYSDGAYLAEVKADITMLGFTRSINTWRYPYQDYKVKKMLRKPEWVSQYYAKARDFSMYSTSNPASERTAVVLSNSFGAYIAPHLAPGFKTTYHINLLTLAEDETVPFFEALLARTQPTDVIYLVHDGALPNQPLQRLARKISQ